MRHRFHRNVAILAFAMVLADSAPTSTLVGHVAAQDPQLDSQPQTEKQSSTKYGLATSDNWVSQWAPARKTNVANKSSKQPTISNSTLSAVESGWIDKSLEKQAEWQPDRPRAKPLMPTAQPVASAQPKPLPQQRATELQTIRFQETRFQKTRSQVNRTQAIVQQASHQTEELPPLQASSNATGSTNPTLKLVEFRDMDLGKALRVLSQQTNINFVASPNAAAINVSSVYLRDVTLTQALDVITTTFNLFYRRDEASNVVLIYTNEERGTLAPDPEVLERQINLAFPNSSVHLSLVGDKIVVRGQAIDAMESEQIIRIVAQSALASRKEEQSSSSLDLNRGSVVPGVTGPNVGQATRPLQQALRDSLIPGNANVVNLLEVPGVQQVMLRVVVAEVNRAAARSIGLNFRFTGNDIQAGSLVGPINNLAQGNSLIDPTAPVTNMLLGTPAMLDNLPISIGPELDLAINALRDNSLARMLAEPNLVALNGETAEFSVGGRFPVPVLSGFSSGTQGVVFQPFGVRLKFTPLVLDRDRVRLHIEAEVSMRDTSLGTSMGGDSDQGGTSVPGIDERRFTTTVELTDSQTLAVAGLIKNDYGATSSRVPFFGDLPIIGRLAAFDRTTASEQELVILVTPELVQAIDTHEHPPLPGSDLYEPNDVEFYLLGRLESRYPKNFRSPVRTDKGRQKDYYRCHEQFMIGPSGFTDVCNSP